MGVAGGMRTAPAVEANPTNGTMRHLEPSSDCCSWNPALDVLGQGHLSLLRNSHCARDSFLVERGGNDGRGRPFPARPGSRCQDHNARKKRYPARTDHTTVELDSVITINAQPTPNTALCAIGAGRRSRDQIPSSWLFLDREVAAGCSAMGRRTTIVRSAAASRIGERVSGSMGRRTIDRRQLQTIACISR